MDYLQALPMPRRRHLPCRCKAYTYSMEDKSPGSGFESTPRSAHEAGHVRDQEKRLVHLCGRASLEAWMLLQRLKNHPRFDRLLALLDTVGGTLQETDIEKALRRVVDAAEEGSATDMFSRLSPQIVRALQEALDAAISLQGADKGNIQLVDSSGALRIVAQRGFERDFLEHFACVRLDGYSICARSFRTASPLVITDVNEDAAFAPDIAIAKSAGFRGVQSIPLVNSSGSVIGMLSVHYRSPLPTTQWRIESLHESAIRIATLLSGHTYS
ncbi:MAG: GAF domain-containing protein [Betaproteobacteria bacterium]